MDNVMINVGDSKGNVFTLTVSKDIAERMKNDQKFLSSVMKKVSAVETKQALISGPACAPNLPQPFTPCPTTSSMSPVPLNLSFVKPLPSSASQCPITRPPVPPSASQCPVTSTRPPVPPSASQCPITITRQSVPLTHTVKDPPSATLQSGAVCENPSEAIQTSPSSIQSDRHESQGIGTAPPGTIQSTPLGLEDTSSKQAHYPRSGVVMDAQPGTSAMHNTALSSRAEENITAVAVEKLWKGGLLREQRETTSIAVEVSRVQGKRGGLLREQRKHHCCGSG
nr:period circadian protein homolog 1-like [Misgurnus anguillicaudatus]